MQTLTKVVVEILIASYFILAMDLVAFAICKNEYDFVTNAVLYAMPSQDGVYYDSLEHVARYLKEGGWVDERVTDDQLEYELLLAEQLSSMTDRVSPALAIATIAKESKFYPDDEYEGAVGLMQLLPKYHQHTLKDICEEPTFDKWYEPRYNIMCGLTYLDELLSDEYACGDTTYALMMYNQGPTSGTRDYLARGYISDYASDIVILKQSIETILEERSASQWQDQQEP